MNVFICFFAVVGLCLMCGTSGLLFGSSKKRSNEESFYTCKHLLLRNPPVYSGIQHISIPSGYHEVYCEMGINGGGYTFISNTLLAKMTQEDLKYLFRNQTDVLLRISMPDSTQPYTIVRQYKNTGGLRTYLNKNNGNPPWNIHMGKYIFIDVISSGIQDKEVTGFFSNTNLVKFKNCNYNTRGFFAFFANPNEKQPSSFHANNLIYEQQGVAVDWRTSARRPYSGRRMPLNYFLFTEMHFGGCGAYTSSDRWMTSKYPALGTAVGLR
ncbi:uncharacterized protein LOC130622974 [Hydractinia symbiolongicarpus]|uniref:uncharacterized protein LOC130622974 n=1 Tax=Hydractinia symbiolongicarpus TaxID=13093 RepID=UPI00254FA283|nr:uncharacterized protein LOC130622974 [Hydractinia symbiolongicarpus]